MSKRMLLKVASALLQSKRKEYTTIGKSVGVDASKYITDSFTGNPESYYADVVITDMLPDKDNDKVPVGVMVDDIKGMKGDLEHINLKLKGTVETDSEELKLLNTFDTTNLFEVVDVKKDGNRKVGKLKFNPAHKQFPVIWKNIGDFGVSPEYKVSKDYNTYEMIGLSGTFTPRNDRAKVLFAYRG